MSKNLFLGATVLSFLSTLVALAASAMFPINPLIPLLLFMVSGTLFVYVHTADIVRAKRDFSQIHALIDAKVAEVQVLAHDVDDKIHRRIEAVERVFNINKLK